MRKASFILTFFLVYAVQADITRTPEKLSDLHKTLVTYFSNARHRYQKLRFWKTRYTIYTGVLLEFAKTLGGDYARLTPTQKQIISGTVSAFVDIYSHLLLLEGNIYQGQWEKQAGNALKREAPRLWMTTRRVIRQGLLEYYRLHGMARDRYFRTLLHTIHLASPKKTNSRFILAYRNTLSGVLDLARLLDGEFSLAKFSKNWLQLLLGYPVDKYFDKDKK